jgi:DNA-binding transcriptional LysR family regulator
VNFHIVSTYEPIERTSDLFDIGFQVGTKESEMFNVESIADDLVYPVCSPNLVRDGIKITPADLAQLPLLHLDVEGYADWPDWRRFLAVYRIREPLPMEGLKFSSYQVLLDAAERGDGVALGWERSVRPRIAEGKLVRLPDMSIHQPDGVCVYTRKHRRQHAITDSVVKTIRSSIATINSPD